MLVTVVTLLLVLNFYPAQAVRKLIISSKETELLERAKTFSATLEEFTTLTQENILVSVQVLDLDEQQRILVTDSFGSVIYDNSKVSSLAGTYALLPDIVAALEGCDVFRCRYGETVFISDAASPVMKGEKAIGAVYIYDYDTEQAAFLNSTRSNIFRISLVLAVVGAAALGFLMVYFGKRVGQLVRGIQSMSAGNYDSRIHLQGQDELSQVADEFNELADRLQKTEELRREFVSNASHELKTPLASIKLLSDSILQTKDIPRESVNEFLTDINEEIDRLTRITERLLQLTKLDYVSSNQMQSCNLNGLVKKITDLLKENAVHAQVEIENRMEEDLWVLFDRDGLYQVVFNLVENAIKYNRKGGKVVLKGWKETEEERRVCLTVQDTGIGIPEDELSHIFERFYRVDKARSREKGGTGLGLAIVADWLKNAGGDIQVESTLGEGTTFRVTLLAGPCEEGAS